MPNPEIAVLLALLDQAFDHKAWHGTNLKGSIKGIDANAAAWRPAPDRHNVWEIVVHAAYWKYAVWRRLRGEKRGSFPLQGSNWFPRPADPAAVESAWKTDTKLLNEMHNVLRESLVGLSSRDLHHTPKGSKFSNLAMIAGIASHDLYHAGQIQLLKRLQVGR
ncbi:MAG: DinB family protein [bacterium]